MESESSEFVINLTYALKNMLNSSADIEKLAVCSTDGIVIAVEPKIEFDERGVELISAYCAAWAALASNLLDDFRKGELESGYLKVELGYIIMRSLPSDFLLIIWCRANAKLGLIWLDTHPGRFLSRAGEPIFPRRPPGRLNAHARPEYPDDDDTP